MSRDAISGLRDDASEKAVQQDKYVSDLLGYTVARNRAAPDTGDAAGKGGPPSPESLKEGPHRAQFARELMKANDGLQNMRHLETQDDGVRTAQSNLTGALAQMGKAADERRYEDARQHLKIAEQLAQAVAEAHQRATKAERDFYSEYEAIAHRRPPALNVLPQTEWTKRAKAMFETADASLQRHIENAAWTEARTALEAVVKTLDDFDKAARQELESKLDVLDGWEEAKAEAGRLRGDLAKLGTPLMGDPGYPGVANAITWAMAGWRDVRRHKVEMAKLAAEFACIADIPDKDEQPVLAAAWTAYDKAKAAAPDPANIKSTGGHERLAGLRNMYREAGRALCREYESGKAGSPKFAYNRSVLRQLKQQKEIPLRLANKVPDATPAVVRLKQEMNQLDEIDYPDAAAIEAGRKVLEKAAQLISMRTASKDQAEVDLFARFRKVEKSLKVAAGRIPATGATPAQQEYKRRYEAFLTKLYGTEQDRIAVCGQELDWLGPEAEKSLTALTNTLKASAKVAAGMPAGTSDEKEDKWMAAEDTISRARPEILARLSAEEKIGLFESLNAAGIPKFDKNNQSSRNDDRRAAMRKLYQAMTLEPEFAEEDAANHKKLIEALRGNKQELKNARDNWSLMTDEQKVAVLRMVMTEHCRQYGFTPPSNGISVVDEPASDDNGSYTPSILAHDPPRDTAEDDKISINKARPVFHDFEAVLDLIIHENTHRSQNVLVRAFRYPTGAPPQFLTKLNRDPPYTQARMFNMGNVPGGYVSGEEDRDIYQKQPEEDHAWMEGPRGAQGIIDMLAEN